jgi:hypothetical protein
MPNHVTTIMRVKSRTKEVFDFIKSPDTKPEDERLEIDFDTLIPMPPELHITSDGFVMQIRNQFMNPSLRDVLKDLKKANEETVDNFCRAIKNNWKYGAPDWYEWAIENWGTKWNAYSIEVRSEDTIKFETAWSHPTKVIHALSKKFPDVEFELQYADEDIGANLGHYTIKDEVESHFEIENKDRFACLLNGYDYEEYERERAEA